jgi:hypothetical protein
MSALEQTPLTTSISSPDDRRGFPRLRVREALNVLFGRGEGIVVDISERGARVRHDAPARLGSHIRLSFEWAGHRFTSNAVVLASRVVALGLQEGDATLFESRVQFVSVTPEAAEVLSVLIESLGTRDLRKWVDNLRGTFQQDLAPTVTPTFIRCRRRFHRWERKWTRDRSQPDDGFTVPASIDENELSLLCRMWDTADLDEREILRQTARASVESAG